MGKVKMGRAQRFPIGELMGLSSNNAPTMFNMPEMICQHNLAFLTSANTTPLQGENTPPKFILTARRILDTIVFNMMSIRVSASRWRANLLCCQHRISIRTSAPVAQQEAQPTCNRQVSGFESPLGLSLLSNAAAKCAAASRCLARGIA